MAETDLAEDGVFVSTSTMVSLKLSNLAVGLGLGLEDASGEKDTLLRCFLLGLGLGLDFWVNFLFRGCHEIANGAWVSFIFLPFATTICERAHLLIVGIRVHEHAVRVCVRVRVIVRIERLVVRRVGRLTARSKTTIRVVVIKLKLFLLRVIGAGKPVLLSGKVNYLRLTVLVTDTDLCGGRLVTKNGFDRGRVVLFVSNPQNIYLGENWRYIEIGGGG